MITGAKTTVVGVKNLSQMECALIHSYLINLVNSWIVKHGNEWFAARDLVGGINSNWNGTDIQILYNKQIAIGKTPIQAEKQAGINLGKLLKKALDSDPRVFDTRCGYTKEYRLK